MSPLFSFPYSSAHTRIIKSIFASNSPKIDPVGLGCQPPKDYFDSAPAPASAFACVPRCVCVCCVLHFSPLNLSKQEKVGLLIFYLETASPASRTLCRLALLYKTRQRRKFPSIALQSTTPFSLTASNRLLQVTCVSEGTDFLLAA